MISNQESINFNQSNPTLQKINLSSHDTSNVSTTKTKNESSFFSDGIIFGIQSGALMAIYLLLLQSFGVAGSITLTFFKYTFLAILVWLPLSTDQVALNQSSLFKNRMLLGGLITFVSGLTLSLINLIAYLINSGLAFEKFGVKATSLGSFTVINSAIFFEVLIIGMIITLICLQLLRNKSQRSV